MYFLLKRLLDIVFSLILLLALSPIFLLLTIIVKFTSSGPVFFKQKRIKKGKKLFYILKFRTMVKNTPNDVPTHMLNDADMYITKIGKILRRTSLDELPQLINIVKGEMSFIGPRPALWNQDDLITERDKYRANDIPVGLTGWAQINGRDDLPITIKAKFDGEYVKKQNFFFDTIIFFKTIVYAITGKGIKEGTSNNA
jgi:O-antigen biosynthesis protein WbqP